MRVTTKLNKMINQYKEEARAYNQLADMTKGEPDKMFWWSHNNIKQHQIDILETILDELRVEINKAKRRLK